MIRDFVMVIMGEVTKKIKKQPDETNES